MTTRGVDIRQSTSRIVFRVSLKDSSGDKVTTGTTELRLYRVEDDGTLDVYDWTTNDFVATGSGTPDDETTMTHQQRRDSGGTDEDTGIWTAVLSTLTNFTSGQIYIAQVTNSNASPESQEREFQFGGVEGDQFDHDADTVDVGSISGDSTAADNLELDYDGTGYNKSNSTIGTTTNNTDMRGTDGAALAANYNATRAGYLDNLDGHTAQTGDTYALASGATGFTAIDTVVDAIKAVTDNLPNSGALTSISTDITSILADTNELQSDDIPALISALNDITVSDILTASLTVAIAADGATPTLQQAIIELLQFLTDFTISGTTYTSKARDGSTTLGTYTLDDATTPTGITRT